MPHNLFSASPPATGERFETLLRRGPVVVEHIMSSDTPDPGLYDQEQDEWVALLQGTATIELSGEQRQLVAGDWLFIPAHTPHRVLATSTGATWLAVHIRS